MAFAACGGEPEANRAFFWTDVDLERAVDLGHEAAPVPAAARRAAGLVTLREVGEDWGLTDSVQQAHFAPRVGDHDRLFRRQSLELGLFRRRHSVTRGFG
ncbi:MAG: hypothetical protein AAF715_19605 [Myxococcota bacterium]